jgi:hypothetical protein
MSFSDEEVAYPFTHDREVRPRRTVHQAVAEQGA